MSINLRRDSFCGKISVCNNLYQYGIRYSLTTLHTVDPDGEAFRADLRRFAAVCRVVRSLRGLRIGQIGARPAAFNTVRYSEKLLERAGITVEPLDLSELLGWIRRMDDRDAAVQQKLEEIHSYTDVRGVPQESLIKLAKLGVAIDRFLQEKELKAVAIQCWTALEEFYGVVPCTPMSMLSNQLIPSACEADIPGVLSMYLLQQASGKPSALLDWNNNYKDELDKGVVFHCSNLPAAFFESQRMDYQEIIAGTVGKENTYGTLVGRIAPGPFTFCGLTTDEFSGRVRVYVGEGRFTDDPLDTFGGYGVFEVAGLQQLLHYVCRNGFPHHVAATLTHVADVVAEALTTYMDWEVYRHVA
jgi:L-fucose isomerase-like protein